MSRILGIETGFDGNYEGMKGLGKTTVEEGDEEDIPSIVGFGVTIAETVQICELENHLFSKDKKKGSNGNLDVQHKERPGP